MTSNHLNEKEVILFFYNTSIPLQKSSVNTIMSDTQTEHRHVQNHPS